MSYLFEFCYLCRCKIVTIEFMKNITYSLFAVAVLCAACGQTTKHMKHIELEGAYNVRDMGGIETADGKKVKWGVVYRADELGNMTSGDWAKLAQVPVVTVVDFRSDQEVAALADNIPTSVKNYCRLPIVPGNLSADALAHMMSDEFDAEAFMVDANVMMVTDSAIIGQYREFFRLLQDPANTPLMFHCSAGKDRTGMAAALFLLSLGVDEETVFEDYLASNVYLEPKYADYIAQMPSLEPMFVVRRAYLQAGLDRIRADHGSVERYLREVLNVDTDKMKEMYLQ